MLCSVFYPAILCTAIAAATVTAIAQQTPPQAPLARRTELVGTAPPSAKIFKVFQFPAGTYRLSTQCTEMLHSSMSFD